MAASHIIIVAHTYASAFLTVVQHNRAGPVVSSQALQMLTKLAQDRTKKIAFNNPTLPRQIKLDLFQNILIKPPHPLLTNLANTLMLHNRLGVLLEVLRAYLILQAIQEGAVPIKVVTAQKLSSEDRLIVLEKIELALCAQVLPSFYEAPEIYGGIKIYIGSYLLDASWSRKLDAMMHKFKGSLS